MHGREALRIIQAFAGQFTGEPVALTAQRWRRGGRAYLDPAGGAATGGSALASLRSPGPIRAAHRLG